MRSTGTEIHHRKHILRDCLVQNSHFMNWKTEIQGFTFRLRFIVGHVHDELIIECSPDVDLNVICKQMGRSPDWMPDILLRADGYETMFYKKD